MTREQLIAKKEETNNKVQAVINTLSKKTNCVDSLHERSEVLRKLRRKQYNLSKAFSLLEVVLFGGEGMVVAFRRERGNPEAVRLSTQMFRTKEAASAFN